MSYEGYTEFLCENGHLRVFDCYNEVDLFSSKHTCRCGAPYVFRHEVDQTNWCDNPDYPESCRYPFEVATPEVVQTCSMGHQHSIREITYVIPTKE